MIVLISFSCLWCQFSYKHQMFIVFSELWSIMSMSGGIRWPTDRWDSRGSAGHQDFLGVTEAGRRLGKPTLTTSRMTFFIFYLKFNRFIFKGLKQSVHSFFGSFLRLKWTKYQTGNILFSGEKKQQQEPPPLYWVAGSMNQGLCIEITKSSRGPNLAVLG